MSQGYKNLAVLDISAKALAHSQARLGKQAENGSWGGYGGHPAVTGLIATGAVPGQLFGICDWEYFTFRFGAQGNCDGGCPSGILRLVALAETNNGADHPECG